MSLKSNNHEKYLKLRSAHPYFGFEGFDSLFSSEGLQVQYHFTLSGNYFFHPTLTIPVRDFFIPAHCNTELLDNLLFHIGMIEMVSYWKAACPPVILVKNRVLSPEQVAWWKDIYYRGLGEFFYLNSLEVTPDDFVAIRTEQGVSPGPARFTLQDSVIIPLGGGKDSVVTLELLGDLPGSVPLILNPRAASLGTAETKGFSRNDIIEINRMIDPTLLELNEKGFLNGHTPFSALLGFMTLLGSVLSGKKYIALSNESSANEATVEGTNINHQYSKTVEFERHFREYVHMFLTPDIGYFSFLRPLNELQIARLFSGFPAYFPVFKSCNAGSKTDSWCGKCPKCLFAWIILSPFVRKDDLLSIFGKDLFEDEKLWPVLQDLAGLSTVKPFECIGTISEVNAALCMLLQDHPPTPLPKLLELYAASSAFLKYREIPGDLLLKSYNTEHFLPQPFEKLLKSRLDA